MLTREEIEETLRSGYELRGLEVKGPGARSDTAFLVRVVRVALGMGNLRDGGHVVIGVEDDPLSAMSPGLEADEVESWLAYDDVARKMAEYADPPLGFRVTEETLSSGVTVVVMQVFEFADIPHLCRKDYPDVLRRGALYVRPRKVPETSEVASSVEMRDVLDLATEKALRSYVETASRAGVRLETPSPDRMARLAEDRYAAERRSAGL